MSTLYRAIWSDSHEADREGVVGLARSCVSCWALNSDEASDLPDGETVVHNRRITVRTLSADDHFGFEFTAVDSPEQGAQSSATWRTEIRVVATGGEVHTWVENGMETDDITARVAVGRPRVVDALLSLPGRHRLGGSGVFTDVAPIDANAVHVLVEQLRNPERQLPVIVVTEAHNSDRWQRWAERVATRAGGVATVVTLDGAAVTEFKKQLGGLAVWGGGIRTYIPAPLESERDGWRHRYVPGKQLLEAEGRAIDRIVYGVTQLSTRRHVPGVFRVFKSQDEVVTAAELERIEDEWMQKLELEYAERNEVEQELARTADHLDRQLAKVDGLEARLSWLRRELEMRGRAELYWAAPQDSTEPVDLLEAITCTTDAIEVARMRLSDDLEIPESAPRELDDIDTATKASAWGHATWRGLRALAAYAKASRAGFEGDFWTWCQRGEPFAWQASTKTLAMKESSTVEKNPRLRRQREFEVAREVDQSGRIVMFAHLKISEGGGNLAPRVYFHDDTGGRTGKVHIGLIGPHYLVQNTKS
ncbi:hypothetical protein SAMN02982929_00519 [Saccharopolyspora kobensis]|uniref:Uncharacterized protein n=1 Tax=Saccharopolyspora kobensis TaxID=146035 RepID=A0A1H5UG45_9PSEU|nr:hypothetical protein [Saccharopolyspora kobensis]SEF74053.1 hypothetical protein SAMN02982929_00519 [Saccharopolyspora kobensis]SFC73725.1 hypothetical protein SAMN05216506_1011551 [Saccharopolyspora kobensis]